MVSLDVFHSSLITKLNSTNKGITWILKLILRAAGKPIVLLVRFFFFSPPYYQLCIWTKTHFILSSCDWWSGLSTHIQGLKHNIVNIGLPLKDFEQPFILTTGFYLICENIFEAIRFS